MRHRDDESPSPSCRALSVLAACLVLELLAANATALDKITVPVADLTSVEADFEAGRIEIVVSRTRYVWIDRNRDPEKKRRALEETLGKPVLTSNQVTLWALLRARGYASALPGLGRLLL